MAKGKIILLNGVPSAGKTTLSKVLQERLPDQYFLLPVDILNVISPQKNSRSYDVRFTADPVPVLSSFYGCVKSFIDNGMNVIVDCVFTKDSAFGLDNFLNLFADCEYQAIFVQVTCPAEELRRREKKRGDRKVGLGESLLEKLDPQDTYDLTVDTFNETLEDCSNKIIELSKHPEKLTAFKTLWLQNR